MLLPLTHQDNLTLLPPIKRASGCFLYDNNGKRYLDLYMANGVATMGHRPTNFGLALKNPIDQGLTMAYPNAWHNRLQQALAKRYPGYYIGLYTDITTVAHLTQGVNEPWQEGNTTYLRPLYDEATAQHHIFLSSIPSSLITIIISKQALPTSQIIPAFIARGALRFVNRREAVVEPRLAKLFDNYPHLWQRHQCYITSSLDKEAYQKLFEASLKQLILLPPTPQSTGLIPSILSDGYYQQLKTLFDHFS